MIKNLMLMVLLLWCFDACSEVSLVIPIATKHIKTNECENNSLFPACKDGFKYNEQNYGLGAEYAFNEKYVAGAMYLDKDSFNNHNYYFYFSRNFNFNRDFNAAISFYVPTNYDNVPFAALFSVTYKMLRVMTTYPLGKIVDAPADVINVQLVIPLKF